MGPSGLNIEELVSPKGLKGKMDARRLKGGSEQVTTGRRGRETTQPLTVNTIRLSKWQHLIRIHIRSCGRDEDHVGITPADLRMQRLGPLNLTSTFGQVI